MHVPEHVPARPPRVPDGDVIGARGPPSPPVQRGTGHVISDGVGEWARSKLANGLDRNSIGVGEWARSELANGLDRNSIGAGEWAQSELANGLDRNSIGRGEWAADGVSKLGGSAEGTSGPATESRLASRRGLEVRGSDAAVKIFPAVSAKC